MLPGECVGINGAECDCGEKLELEILRSNGGWYYLGYFCPQCGPFSRETTYLASREEAEKVLNNKLKLFLAQRALVAGPIGGCLFNF